MENTGLNNPLAFLTAGSFITKNWKWIAGIGGGIFVMWLFYDKFLKVKNPSNLPISHDNKKPSSKLSDSEARQIADLIESQLKGWTTSNNKKTVLKSLAGLSYNDFVKVNNAFGRRWRSDSLIPEKLNLTQWFSKEFNSEDMNLLRALMPNVLGSPPAVRTGSKVASLDDDLRGYQVENKNGRYQETGKFSTYNLADTIGKVKDFDGDFYAVIEKGFFRKDEVLPINEITAIA